jgi:hypothetical protein
MQKFLDMTVQELPDLVFHPQEVSTTDFGVALHQLLQAKLFLRA